MDVDGNPEILIQAKKKDSITYTTIYAYEFSDNKAQKLDFPKLSASQRKGYRGEDNFYIQDGKFMREFPIYEGSGKAAKLTGAKRRLEYSLSSNEINVKQISKDSVSKTNIKTPEPVAKKGESKKAASKKTKKHAQPVKHKKKHHRDDDY